MEELHKTTSMEFIKWNKLTNGNHKNIDAESLEELDKTAEYWADSKEVTKTVTTKLTRQILERVGQNDFDEIHWIEQVNKRQS